MVYLQNPGHDPGLLPAPDVVVGVQHGPHQGGSRAGNTADEDEGTLPVVVVDLSLLVHHRGLPRDGGRVSTRASPWCQPTLQFAGFFWVFLAGFLRETL